MKCLNRHVVVFVIFCLKLQVDIKCSVGEEQKHRKSDSPLIANIKSSQAAMFPRKSLIYARMKLSIPDITNAFISKSSNKKK